jgi:single-strand DNA-binding protein
MVDINHVILLGRLTRDAELKVLTNGQAVCKFSIAVNRRKKSGEQWVDEPNFFDIVLWGRQGETLSQYLVKGKQVAIDGELRQDRWEQDGQNRSKVEIIANNIQLLGGGNSAAGGYAQNNNAQTGAAYGGGSQGASYNGANSYGSAVPYGGPAYSPRGPGDAGAGFGAKSEAVSDHAFNDDQIPF